MWDLPTQALCPVIGVCLPMAVLRRRVDKLLGGETRLNDYELHCGAINACDGRSPIAELLQAELEQRFVRSIRAAAAHKSTQALSEAWQQASQGEEVAGALWATLTHARCDAGLQEQVLRDIHMLQHQVGSANRADLQRLEALEAENQVLGRELARAQARSSKLLEERATVNAQQAAELMRLRAELLGSATLLASLRDELAQLEAAVPGLRQRHAQAEQIQHQFSRIQDLERALLASQQQLERERRRNEEAKAAQGAQDTLHATPARQNSDGTSVEPGSTTPQLGERAILCVGGRRGVIPIYRQLVERSGGRFLHHDGGEEDACAKLDASLAAADLVICQTGCISHDAYWRVKDHCKRHGKQCVFVEKPSTSSLAKALASLAPAAKEVQASSD
ncbi:MAG: DUF2325 domain-containing protein [Burkholderiaceae bacterium]|nr:DUF2325 domain-containing protein [Burkholderiaceae bacterium]